MDDPPPLMSQTMDLSQSQAYGLLMSYCLIYVLPLYASADTRPSRSRSRDAPQSIRARIRSVSFSTTTCSLTTLLLLLRICRLSSREASGCAPWHLMGYWPLGLAETARACLLTIILFAGPLYECLIIDGVWQQWRSRLQPLWAIWTDWPTWRSLVAGPVTEECLFRSAAVPLLLMAGSTQVQIIFLSPIVFGLAHLHHFYEFRITYPQTRLSVAIARSILQFCYTSLFGAYATFLFLRTGSLLAVILVHTLCNSLGLPRVWGKVEPYWISPDVASGSGPSLQSRPNSAVIWTVVYYVLLLSGSIAWWKNLYGLTESPMALAT